VINRRDSGDMINGAEYAQRDAKGAGGRNQNGSEGECRTSAFPRKGQMEQLHRARPMYLGGGKGATRTASTTSWVSILE